jgi:hypothetical protein
MPDGVGAARGKVPAAGLASSEVMSNRRPGASRDRDPACSHALPEQAPGAAAVESLWRAELAGGGGAPAFGIALMAPCLSSSRVLRRLLTPRKSPDRHSSMPNSEQRADASIAADRLFDPPGCMRPAPNS